MKKVALLVTISLLLFSLCCGCCRHAKEQGSELTLVGRYIVDGRRAGENRSEGKLYRAGKINVVVLNGTYGQMGMQYGSLLKKELYDNYQGIVEGIGRIEGLSLKELEEFGAAIFEKYPRKYQEIIEGLAETSGLGLEKAKTLNAQELYISAALVNWASEANKNGKCSGMAVWGPYTADGPLVFGRNYDLGFFNAKHATVTVYNPIDGSIPTANLTFAGCVYVTSGMNRSGLFLELNNGSTSDTGDYTDARVWAPASLFSFLENADTLDQLAYFFNTTNTDLAYIINAADPDSACSFEWATYGVKRRAPDQDGLLVATNHFVDPSWGLPAPTGPGVDTDYTVQRRENLLALGEENKGKFNPEVMMRVIETPLEAGGSFRAPNLTSYEIVAVPEDLTIWVRVPEIQDWVEIDLSELFIE